MSLLSFLLCKNKKSKIKEVSEIKEELLFKQGKEQFSKLIEKGLQIPIALL